MKTKLFFGITILLIGMVYCMSIITFVGCQKEKISPAPKNETVAVVENVSNQDSVKFADELKNGNNTWIMNVSSANDIPSQMFSVDYKYKTSYQHMKMNYTSNGFGKCSWTSYVITAACIIKGNCSWCSYPVSYAKVDQVMNICVQYAGSNINGSAITTLKWYCQNYDYSKLSCFQKSTSNSSSGRFEAIKWMLDHLLAKKSPFMVIGTSGNKGHYLIVHAIDWKRGGTGSIVYYTDCLTIVSNNNSSYNANVKTMDLSSFLNNMVSAPSMYNMLFIWPKAY